MKPNAKKFFPEKPKPVQLSIRIPPSLYERVQKLRKQSTKKVSFNLFCETALDYLVKHLEGEK